MEGGFMADRLPFLSKPSEWSVLEPLWALKMILFLDRKKSRTSVAKKLLLFYEIKVKRNPSYWEKSQNHTLISPGNLLVVLECQDEEMHPPVPCYNITLHLRIFSFSSA